MKNVLNTFLLTLILACGLAAPASAQTRVGTIDLRKLFDKFWKTQQADAALKATAGDLDKEHKGLMDSYAKANDEAKKLSSAALELAISTDEREKRKKAAEDKLVELKQLEQSIKEFEAQARQSLDDQRKRMRDSVLELVQGQINVVARAENFDIVLDTAAESINNTHIVLFTNGASDLTDRVLAKLNADAPPPSAGASKSDDKKSDAKSDKKDEPKSDKK